ncbi:MAG: hypothetical protein FWD31_08170 [Planctomycetaceae bacterium]|nr:hypothetical protein [Planctomycetaceae bacterium]
MKTNTLIVFGILLVFVAGCTNKKKEVTIQGTVTVEGKTVDGGTIQFIPVSQDGFEGGGLISQGKFTAIVPYGEMLVKFRGIEYEQKDADGNPLGGQIVKDDQGRAVNVIDPPAKRLIPDRYWTNSDVKVTVESAKQKFVFDLKAK